MEPRDYQSVPPPVVNELPPALPPEPSAHKKKIIIGAAVAIVILLAAAYVLWVTVGSHPAKQAVTPADTSESRGTGNQDIDDATSILTDGADDETDLTDTDDAARADDAIQSATNVGNSINENNF